MNKHFSKTTWMTILSVLLFIFIGCSDDSNEPENPLSSNVAYLNWGAPKSEVMNYMKNYEMNIMDNDFICYIGRNNVQTISYQFQDNGLQASLILIPQDKITTSELQSSFSKYEYLGEKNGLNIYISETTNTLATIAQKVKGETTYYAIGYTILNIETGESLNNH